MADSGNTGLPGKLRRRAAARNVLAAAVFLAALMAASFGSGLLIDRITSSVRDIGYDHLVSSTKAVAQNVDDRLTADRAALSRFADAAAGLSAGQIAAELPMFAATQDFPAVYVLFADGTGFDAAGNPVLATDLPAPVTALEGEPGVSGDYFDSSGFMRSLIQAPIERDGQVTGAVCAELIPQRYYAEDTFAFWKGSGRAFVVSADDGSWVVNGPLSDMLPGGLSTVYEALGRTDGGQELADGLRASMVSSGSDIFRVSYDGRTSYLCLAKSAANPSWRVMTLLPADELNRESDSVAALLRVTQVVLVVGLAVAFAALAFYGRQRQRRRIERVKSEQERTIRDQDRRLSEIARREYDCQVVIDLDDQTCRVEPYGEGMWKSFPLAGKFVPYRDLYEETRTYLDDADVPRFEELLEPGRLFARFQSSTSAVPQFRFHVSGGEKDVWVECSVYFSEADGARRACIMCKDVTAAVLAQQEIERAGQEREQRLTELQMMRDTLQEALRSAEQANSAKSRFLSSVSHDIRTPMNAIVCMTDLAAQQADDPAKVRECLSEVSHSSHHLLDLINDILDFSKIESGKLSLVSEDFDLRALADQTVAIVRPLCAERGQTLDVSVDVQHPRLVGDPVRLRQVLINLLNNACKYTPEGGRIAFSVDEVRGAGAQEGAAYASFRFVVADNGIGIAAENLDGIFGAFEREVDSTVNAIEGTGLGLAITKSIVQAMGGTIGVKSERGRGAEFTVIASFKRCEPDEGAKGPDGASGEEPCADAPAAVLGCSGMRFLVADDHPVNRKIVGKMLAAAGAASDFAENGRQAVELFEGSEPGTYDAVLMDVRMPVMDGYAATRAIRAGGHPDARTVRIVAMTANAFAEDRQASLDAGMDAHVDKPLEAKSLAAALNSPLRRH